MKSMRALKYLLVIVVAAGVVWLLESAVFAQCAMCRASLAGSIIGNVLLVLGSAMLIGGWRYRRQQFDPRVAGQYAAMLAVVVIGMAVPSLLATVGESTRPGAVVVRGNELHHLSIGVALILLLCYVAYIAYSVFNVRAIPKDARLTSMVPVNNDEKRDPNARSLSEEEMQTSIQGRPKTTGKFAILASRWKTTFWLPIAVLAGATAVTAAVSEVLVSTIEPLTHQVGLNPFFVDNNVNSPTFLGFFGTGHRSFNGRIRFLGKK